MNARLPALRCEACGEACAALYEHDGNELCGGCLSDALEPEQQQCADDEPRADYAPDTWRRW